MQIHVQQVIKRLDDVSVWLDNNDGPLQNAPAYPALKTQLAAQEARIIALSQAQQTHIGGASQQVVFKNQLLEAVRDDNDRIARGARAIALGKPGFDTPFAMPASHGEQAVIGTARTFLGLLAVPATLMSFTDLGMPADLISHLQSDVAHFNDFNAGKDAATQARIAALRELDEEMNASSQTVDAIDAAVHFVFESDENALAGWNNAKRLGHLRAHRA